MSFSDLFISSFSLNISNSSFPKTNLDNSGFLLIIDEILYSHHDIIYFLFYIGLNI